MKDYLKNIKTGYKCVYEPAIEENEPKWILSKRERDAWSRNS